MPGGWLFDHDFEVMFGHCSSPLGLLTALQSLDSKAFYMVVIFSQNAKAEAAKLS